MPTRLFAFLDTNVLLHGLSIEQVDWPKLLEVDEVVLVLDVTVLRELDKVKDGSEGKRSRQRAREFSTRLDSFEGDVASEDGAKVRDGVRLRLLGREPRIREGFDSQVMDDRILCSILDFIETESRVVLIARDRTILLKAKLNGIRPLRLPEHLELKAQPDELEVENAKLLRELHALKNRLPDVKLDLLLRGGQVIEPGTVVGIRLPIPRDRAELEKAVGLERERVWHKLNKQGPVTPFQGPVTPFLAFGRPTRAEVEVYLTAYAAYLHQIDLVQLERAHRIDLRIRLRNTGSAPTSRTEVDLRIDEPLQFASLGDLPAFPEAPKLRGGIDPFERDMRAIADSLRFDRDPSPLDPAVYPAKVSYSLSDLMHNQQETFNSFSVVVPPGWNETGFRLISTVRVAEVAVAKPFPIDLRTEVLSVTEEDSAPDLP